MDLSLKLFETGMVIKTGSAPASAAGASSKGELAEPSHYTQMLALWGELVDLTVLTDNRRRVPYEVRRREMDRRFIRDPKNLQAPLIVKAFIGAEKVLHFDRESRQKIEVPGVGLAYKAQIQVPDDKGMMQSVWAVPHILVDGAGGIIPYGKFEQTPMGLVVNAAEHFCLVIRPIKPKQPYRLVPLGLASASRLDMWNRVAEGLPGRGLPKIDPIRHNLFAKEGARYLVYTPPGMWEFEGDERESESATKYNFGHICGQTARLIIGSGFPPYDDNEACTFSEPRVFLVELGERSIGLRYVGRKGQVKLLQGTIDLGKPLSIDPFAALGISLITADPYIQARRAFDLAANGAFSIENPLFAYAVQIGLVDPTDIEDVRSVRSSLNRLAGLVVSTLRQQLDDMKTRIVSQLTIDKLPGLDVIHDSKSAEEVWYRNTGKDTLVDWINARIDGAFDWNSWLHRGVRMELLKHMSKNLFPPPRQTKSQSAVTASAVVSKPAPVPVPVPADIPASAAEPQIIAAEPLKKVRKPRTPKASKT